jgi:hypothetical protein
MALRVDLVSATASLVPPPHTVVAVAVAVGVQLLALAAPVAAVLAACLREHPLVQTELQTQAEVAAVAGATVQPVALVALVLSLFVTQMFPPSLHNPRQSQSLQGNHTHSM